MRNIESMTPSQLMYLGRKVYLQEIISKAVDEGKTENDLYVDYWTEPKLRLLGDAWNELKSLAL